ncbi:MAG: hypothetical protein EXR79_07825 [Myxococcales bacterium]|nr:hypothetical protein [Myxococcales bacterium]
MSAADPLTAAPPPWSVPLPWLAGLLLVGATWAPIDNSDVPMHAAVGRWMLEHGRALPTPDPFVWTDRGGDQPHEWLAQLVIGAVADMGGLNALKGLLALVAAGCVALLVRLGRQHRLGPPATALLVAGWTLLVLPHLTPRPHALAWLFALAVVGLGVGDAAPWSRARTLGWTLLTVLWANTHSSAVIAPMYAGLGLAEVVVAHRSTIRASPWRELLLKTRPWREPALRTVALGAAGLCQPLGLDIVGYVLRSQAINGALSDEWQPLLAFDVARTQPMLLAVFGALAARAIWTAVRARGTADAPGTLAALVAVAHAAATRRMTAFLFVTLLFVLARPLPLLRAGATVAALASAAAALACAVGGVLALVSHAGGPAVDGRVFPVLATAFLHETKLTGRLFNPDAWGGYLAWHLAPRQQVYLDGRWLLAGQGVVEDGIAMQVRAPGHAALFEKHRLDVFVQRHRDYLQVPPPDPSQFQLAWQDGLAVVLLRRGPAFAANRASICAFYKSNPHLRGHAGWRLRLTARPGQRAPTDVPAVWPTCDPAATRTGTPPVAPEVASRTGTPAPSAARAGVRANRPRHTPTVRKPSCAVPTQVAVTASPQRQVAV